MPWQFFLHTDWVPRMELGCGWTDFLLGHQITSQRLTMKAQPVAEACSLPAPIASVNTFILICHMALPLFHLTPSVSSPCLQAKPTCLASFFSSFPVYAQLLAIHLFITPVTTTHLHTVYKHPTTLGLKLACVSWKEDDEGFSYC